MHRYINYHKHTHYSNISTLDCIVKPEDYCKRAIELGHTEYVTTEHGYGGNIFESNTLCEKYGLRCIYGVEAYFVDNRFESDRSNHHIILIAMTDSGRKQINKIISEANTSGFYYKARIDLELLLKLNPNDVIVTTACVASRLFVGDDWLEKFFLPVKNHFGNSLFLEIQSHNHPTQIIHNQKIKKLSEEYNIKLIHANDSHYIFPDDSKYRNLFLQAKGMNYGDESDFVLDYPDYDTIINRYKEQNVFSEEQIITALNNTLIIDNAEPIKTDKEFKIPKITKDDSNKELKKIINQAWKKEKEKIPKEKHNEYIKEIRYEYDMIEKCGMSDYFILDHLIVNKAVNEYDAVLTRTGRGSAVSYYINKLLGLTEIDRISSPVKLYPTRFMTDTRILESRSIPDVDLNWSSTGPVIKASQDYLGEDGIRQMVAFKPLQNSSAFRLWCKAKGMDIKEYDNVAKDLGEYKKEYTGIYANDEYWMKLIDESKVFRGVIESVAPSPCSYLLFDKPISEEIGIIKIKDIYCCILDGYNCDVYKYLKNDYLLVTVWDIISKVYQMINQPIDTIENLTAKLDDKVWDLYANGITSTLNQADSDYDKQILKKYKPSSVTEMCAYVAAIRPGFATQLQTFVNRDRYTTGVKELDDILKDSSHYMMYQESIMKYLVWLGIPEKNTYDIIKKISKKKFKEEELKELKSRLLKGWINNVGSDEGFEKTWEIVEAAASYSFNASHSLSVAYDSLYGAYLKANYPLEYYTVCFNIYKDDIDKTNNLTQELDYFGITLESIKFRHSDANYNMDKENRTIYKGISSVKYMNEEISNELYKMKDTEFNSFIDFLNVNPCNSRQTEILIKLDFFSEFGKSQKLLKMYDMYKTFGGKKQITKTKIGFPAEMILKYATETEKMYKFTDMNGFLSEVGNLIEDKNIPIQTRLLAEKEYFGYICYRNPKAKHYYYITKINTKYSPKLELYSLCSGETLSAKVSKKDFDPTQFIEESVMALELIDKNKSVLIDGRWNKSDETEKWINRWKVVTI